MKNKTIKIVDWAGNDLFIGPYDDKKVDQVLDANRCNCDYMPNCPNCDETGYSTDISIYWNNENNEENVYEYINY